jgi:hypothetical protein
MAKYGFPIACAADVKFKSVSAVLQCQIEGGDGILSRVAARAAMTEE